MIYTRLSKAFGFYAVFAIEGSIYQKLFPEKINRRIFSAAFGENIGVVKMYAIEAINLTKKYKNQRGAENISLTIEQGEIFGLLGPNGCGKTTIMKMLVGLLHADSGEFRIFEKKPDEEIDVMSQVGCMIENPVFYPYLTAYENLKILLKFYPELSQKRIDEVLEELELTKYKDEPVGKFSMGMKQRLGFGAAILHKPKLLILDEPTNGLDIKGTAKIRHILKAYTQSGGTILISSHIADEIQRICTKAAVMMDGNIIDKSSITTAIIEYGSVEDYYLHIINEKEAAE